MRRRGRLVAGAPCATFGVRGTSALVDQTTGAVHASVYPGRVLGSYRVAVLATTGTGTAANGILFSAKWADPTVIAAPISISVGWLRGTSSSPISDFEAITVRNFVSSDTGGTAIDLTRNNQKMRATMAPSSCADMRFASGIVLSAGATRTLDAQAFASVCLPSATSQLGNGSPLTSLYNVDAHGQHPVMWGYREGFNIRTPNGFAGTVNPKFYIAFEWCEVAAS